MSPGKAPAAGLDQMARIRTFNDRMNRWGPFVGIWLILVSAAYGQLRSVVVAWVVFVAGLLGIIARNVVVRRRRRPPSAVEEWAAEHGWDYAAASSVVPLSGRDVLSRVLDGVAVTSYTAVAAPDLTTETSTDLRHMVCTTVPADLPTLLVLPEAVPRRPGAAPLAPDIQFESDAFNARWRVHCADAEFAHAFCHPLVMELLMRPDARGVSLFVEGRDVVVHAPGPTDVDAVESRAALAADLTRLVPPYLIARYPGRTRRRRGGPGRWYRLATALTLLALAGAATLLVLLAREDERWLPVTVKYGAALVVFAAVVVRSALVDRRRARARRDAQR